MQEQIWPLHEKITAIVGLIVILAYRGMFIYRYAHISRLRLPYEFKRNTKLRLTAGSTHEKNKKITNDFHKYTWIGEIALHTTKPTEGNVRLEKLTDVRRNTNYSGKEKDREKGLFDLDKPQKQPTSVTRRGIKLISLTKTGYIWQSYNKNVLSWI